MKTAKVGVPVILFRIAEDFNCELGLFAKVVHLQAFSRQPQAPLDHESQASRVKGIVEGVKIETFGMNEPIGVENGGGHVRTGRC